MNKTVNGKWTVRIAASALLVSAFMPVPVALAAEAPAVDAKAAFVIDSETDKVLLNQNGDESLGIASMTKMLSIYLVLEAVKEGKIAWDQKVPLSEYALELSQDYELSNVPLRSDFTYTVRDLYEASLIYSANAATVALAELVAGTEPAFVDLMKAQLDEWGIKDYAIYNVTGLPNEYADKYGQLYPGAPVDTENHMTARGVAEVADRLIQDFPEVLETTKLPEKTFMEGSGDEIPMKSYNHMLPGLILEREGVDGLKTGTGDNSGASFTGTATEGDMRIITVLIGADESTKRFTETDRMMDYAFNNFEKKQIVTSGSPLETNGVIPIDKGKEEEVGLLYNENVSVVLPREAEGTFASRLTLNPELVNEDGNIEAPVEQGTEVGTVSLSLEEDTLGYLDGSSTQEVKIAVAETVEKANFLELGWRWISGAVAGGWSTVTGFLSGFFG